MKHVRTLLALIAVALLAAVCAYAGKEKQAELLKEAKITKDQAVKTALAKVPDGAIKESELERENGKLVWSFDIATPGTKDITEVQVDAITGDIVSVETESAAAEAKEKQAGKDKHKAAQPAK